eukprot:6177838-Pleurochrysis_carterae.AAC.2
MKAGSASAKGFSTRKANRKRPFAVGVKVVCARPQRKVFGPWLPSNARKHALRWKTLKYN